MHVERGRIQTPAGLVAHLSGMPGSSGTEDEGIVVDGIAGMLEASTDAGGFVCAVRLAELTPGFVSEEMIADMAGPNASLPLTDACTRRYLQDAETCRELLHGVHRQAADRVILSKGKSLFSSPWPIWALRGFDRLRIMEGDITRAEFGRDLGVRRLKGIAADMLADRPTVDTLGRIPWAELDHWQLLPAVFEVVANWDSFEASPAVRDLIEDLVRDRRRMGAYVLAEALMYLREDPPPATVNYLAVAIDRMILESESYRELALILDAMIVGGPKHERLSPIGITEDALDRHETDPNFIAALYFPWLYHGDIVREEAPIRLMARVARFDFAQASNFAWMMKWHFVHQAQNRSLMGRHRITDWDYLTPVRRDRRILPRNLAVDLVRSVREMARYRPVAGWAFHLLVNMFFMRGFFDADDLVDEILAVTPTRSPGVATAILAHDVPDDWLSAYLMKQGAAGYLAQVAHGGVRIEGWNVRPPDFHFVRRVPPSL